MGHDYLDAVCAPASTDENYLRTRHSAAASYLTLHLAFTQNEKTHRYVAHLDILLATARGRGSHSHFAAGKVMLGHPSQRLPLPLVQVTIKRCQVG